MLDFENDISGCRVKQNKIISDVSNLFKNADEINSVIIKNIDKCYDRVDEILEVYKMKKVIFITRDEASSDLSIFKNSLVFSLELVDEMKSIPVFPF